MDRNDPVYRNYKHLLDCVAEKSGDVNFMEFKTPGGIEGRTYSRLKEDVYALSRFFIKENLQGAHVAMVGGASYEWAAAFLGVCCSGSVCVPLAPTEKEDMNLRLTEFADCTVFCYDKKHLHLYEIIKENLPSVKRFISLDNSSENGDTINISDIFSSYRGELAYEPDPQALCAIMFTSGTTGFPKGVMLTHRNFMFTGTSVHRNYPTQRMMGCLPFHHAFGLTGNITKTMVYSRTLCMNDEMKNLAADFRLYKPNGMLAVPQIIKFLFSAAFRYAEAHSEMSRNEAVKEFFGGEMIDFACGAAPFEAELNDKFNATGLNVFNGYGMTECSPIVANNVEIAYCPGSVGKPIPCMDCRIVDGEIQLKGPNVMQGYYKNEEETKAAFTPDGWLKTGDLGYLNNEGFLFITGRLKNLILLDNGENVSAEFLEEKLTVNPLVKECVCFGENGAIFAEIYPDRQYASMKGIDDVEEALNEIIASVNKTLASYQHIAGFVLRDIPFERTASNKIKRGLPHGKISRKIVLPETDNERKVVATVKELLGVDQVSVTDDFFAVGGDSLRAVELALTLNINQQAVYDNSVLRSLAAVLDSLKEQDTGRIENINNLIKSSAKGRAEPYKTALITGGTGFLGSHILKELTESDLETIYCLVRRPEKLKARCAYYFDNIDLSRVIPLRGNIEEKNLGLEKEEYEKLLSTVDTVFHVAANVHHAGDYKMLEKTNVKGTKNVIDFCIASGAVMQHTSTVSVHGSATVIEDTEKAVFDENILDIGQRYSDNVYIHSKYRAEEEVISARSRGLRANVFRIGNLTWRASDGVFQKNSDDNGFLHRMRAIVKLGIYHENMAKYPTDLTAVDKCAEGYVKLALDGEYNEIYHMINPDYLDERDMFRYLDVPFRITSTAECIETAMANTDDRDIHIYMFYMIISGRSNEVELRCDTTVKKLSALGFEWNKIDGDYLKVSPTGKSHILDFAPFNLKPMRNGGGSITPIGKLTLGVLADAKIKNSRVIKGEGTLSLLKGAMESLCVSKPFLITVPFSMPDVDKFISSFGENITVFRDISAEPTVSDTDRALKQYLENDCDCVVAIGGGSVLDTAKVTALRAANPGRYIGDICKLDSRCNNAVPFFAVPTTAGTGSEATLFAVVTEEDKNKKRPFTSDKFLPDVVVLDPKLTVSMPRMGTAYTGIDALSHAVESYVSLFAPYFPEDAALAPEQCRRIFANLKKACDHPDNIEVRSLMQRAAYKAGISFSRIGTGYIHAIAHRFGEFYHVPHGLAIAAAFTPVLRACLPYGRKELAKLAVYCGIGRQGDKNIANAERFIDAVDKLIEDLGIDKYAIPFKKEDAHDIALKAQEEAKLVGYPRAFSDKQVEELVISIFEKERTK